MRKLSLSIVLAGMALAVGGATQAADAPPVSGDAVKGKLVYQRYCVSCHGAQGNGQGEAAEWLTVKPRDFRQGTFKWRSTPSGSLPLDSDLEHTLENGLYGTYMPTWQSLDATSKHNVIAYIKTFSARFGSEHPEAAIAIPVEPPYTEESAKRGAATYAKFNCAQCHGPGGQGDGPSAHELKDDWGNQLVPYNLTNGHVKCGDTSQDIYRVFMTGLAGTPMPSFADSISPTEAWDLVHFIQSLSPGYAKNYGPNAKRGGT